MKTWGTMDIITYGWGLIGMGIGGCIGCVLCIIIFVPLKLIMDKLGYENYFDLKL